MTRYALDEGARTIVQFRTFDWNTSNVEHIAHHRVEPFEVEEACHGGAVILRGRGGRYLAYGRTAEGRYLFVVFYSLGGGATRVITARDMTQRERRFYHGRH